MGGKIMKIIVKDFDLNKLFSFMSVYSGLSIYLWKTDDAELCSLSNPSYISGIIVERDALNDWKKICELEDDIVKNVNVVDKVDLKQYFKYNVPDYVPLQDIEILVLNHLWMLEIWKDSQPLEGA
jgi:hypothetical protein